MLLLAVPHRNSCGPAVKYAAASVGTASAADRVSRSSIEARSPKSWFDEVAALASRALGVDITYDGTDEGFEKYCGDAIRAYIGTPDAVDYYLHYFQFEQDNETCWRKSDIVEFLTGRPAKRLEDWLTEHRDAVLGVTEGA